MKTKPMGVRLAFREEGSFWNVYLAQDGTMENAKQIGSIAMGAVRNNERIKKDFMNVMKLAMADAIEGVGLTVESWEERAGPERERSGHS